MYCSDGRAAQASLKAKRSISGPKFVAEIALVAVLAPAFPISSCSRFDRNSIAKSAMLAFLVQRNCRVFVYYFQNDPVRNHHPRARAPGRDSDPDRAPRRARRPTAAAILHPATAAPRRILYRTQGIG